MRIGVGEHSKGKWEKIKKDPRFSKALCRRSAVDLKDKWRNIVRNKQDVEIIVGDDDEDEDSDDDYDGDYDDDVDEKYKPISLTTCQDQSLSVFKQVIAAPKVG